MQHLVHVDEHGGSLRIVIRDGGPGLPDPALLERVFEPYFRAGGREGRPAPEGTGLGLTIARGIATAHGGTLALKNRVEDGQIAGLDAALVLLR
ncbi:sensor histidine kinase [Burkholderia gladioli]|uniref:sensor histidine kinase n=1 Tax=Burkholderia gladioli TaxID=28095 RepID=UPI001F3CA2A5|nr:sensor histidine kinase [Burkholderia gladioli]MCH7269616.1 sensor histidine kinase [Burkholderia gladioli]MDZ4036922.1 sensor histidine kinase [Burkholderia gladioli pv. alliicola]MEB2546437.1 sensor histidine kinase [Burkholderia gladioli]